LQNECLFYIFATLKTKTQIKMKKISLCSLMLLSLLFLKAQINPTTSPFSQNGSYTVVMDSVMTTTPDILIFRPSTPGPYPTVLFQPGANPSGSNAINKHSYDLYWQHLASYGYVVIIMNNMQGGPNANIFKNMHNHIKTEVAAGGWWGQYIDLNKFIVAGHSNGGMNATDIIIDRPTEIHAIVYMASYPNPGMLGLMAQNVANYTGKVLLMCGDEDDTSAPLVGATNTVAKTAHDSRFTSASCKSWVLFNGIGHGGFGDYDNANQPVGSIGRAATTASIRHMLVGFLNSQFKSDALAFGGFNTAALRPNSVGEFQNTCTLVGTRIGVENSLEFNAYPNPFNNNITIEFNSSDNYLVRITDNQGRVVYSENSANNNILNIDVQFLTSGFYFMEVVGNNQKSILKLIKH
jgi:hypothetical protein